MSKEVNSAKTKERRADLKLMTVTELKELATDLQLDSITGLRKDELIEVIVKTQAKKLLQEQDAPSDWLEVDEAGPYWLAIKWQVSEKLLKRAIASLGKDWHSARKVIRLFRVHWDDSGPHAREHYKDCLLPANAKNWFVNIEAGKTGWKLELGFLAPGGKFFSLLHSADIQIDGSQNQQFTSTASSKSHLNLSSSLSNKEELKLGIEGEISLNGSTTPGAEAVVDDDQVKVNEKTGLFSWKTPLQNGRVVIPVVSELGNQRLRAIISVEANIHYLEQEKTGIDS